MVMILIYLFITIEYNVNTEPSDCFIIFLIPDKRGDKPYNSTSVLNSLSFFILKKTRGEFLIIEIFCQ